MIRNLKRLFWIFLFLPALSFGQIKRPAWFGGHDTAAYYMASDQQLAFDAAHATFMRLIIIKPSEKLFEVQDWFPNDKLHLLAFSSIGTYLFQPGLQGVLTYYYPQGGKKVEKTYEKGKFIGDETSYYQNGTLRSIIGIDATESYYLKKFQDSTGKVLANNGIGHWRKFNDEIPDEIMEGNIVNGKEDGIWQLSGLDTAKHQIIYRAGKVVKGSEFIESPREVFTVVEKQPSFPGGQIAFSKFLQKNLRYPSIAFKNNVQGRVVLTFVVEKDGSINSVTVLRGLGSGLDEEAVRVIEMSPRWSPGIQNSKPVRVQYSIPINFSISSNTTFVFPSR